MLYSYENYRETTVRSLKKKKIDVYNYKLERVLNNKNFSPNAQYDRGYAVKVN